MKYEYKCGNCQATVEVERSMHAEASNPTCSDCKEIMNRVWTSAPVTFKGSGWYSTDNRK